MKTVKQLKEANGQGGNYVVYHKHTGELHGKPFASYAAAERHIFNKSLSQSHKVASHAFWQDNIKNQGMNEAVSAAAKTLDTHIANVRKSVKTSEPKHNTYAHGGDAIKNQKFVHTHETHQDLFHHLKGHGYKKSGGFDSNPNSWTTHHNPETMTHTTDAMHHPSGVSVHLSKEHGSPTKMTFTHHSMKEHVDVGNKPPETYLDTPHLVRLNTILTQITGKLFLNLQTYVDAVRATLDFHGFKLPHLDCEQVIGGPNMGVAYGDLKHGAGFENNRNTPTVAPEFEYVFQLKYDYATGAFDGNEPEEYLYMIASQVKLENEGNFWECYAQVVDSEELADLMSNEEDPRDFPDLTGDVSGETEYKKLQRHTNTTGTSPELE